MDDPDKFQCLKCATCCRNLLEKIGGVLRGLPLTEQEVSLFPREVISPKVALGVDEPETIIQYQLNLNCCPYVSACNDCRIYDKRPLMCQSFPIVAGAISNRCQVFNYRKPGLTYNEPYSMKAQLEANEKLEKALLRQIKKGTRKGTKLWEYDLNSKKWKAKGTL
jgi:Fe-S-cluster containining protein